MQHHREDQVRRLYDCYRTADRAAIEGLLADDFTFTSPYDDHIDRATYFDRCWPAAGTFQAFDLKDVRAEGDTCFALYEGRSEQGVDIRNAELFRFDGDRIASVEVFFGLPAGGEARTAEQEVAAVIEAQVAATQARDADAIMAPYADGMTSFDVIPPLRYIGKDAVRRRLDSWFASYDGGIESEIRDLEAAAAGDVAFCHFLRRFKGTMTSGTRVDMWVRVTLGLRKQQGAWRIVHQHLSDPFDPDSGQARTDLQP